MRLCELSIMLSQLVYYIMFVVWSPLLENIAVISQYLTTTVYRCIRIPLKWPSFAISQYGFAKCDRSLVVVCTRAGGLTTTITAKLTRSSRTHYIVFVTAGVDYFTYFTTKTIPSTSNVLISVLVEQVVVGNVKTKELIVF